MSVRDRVFVPRSVAPALYSAFLGSRRARQTWRDYRDLQDNQWRSPSQIADKQFQTLQSVVDRAGREVPYYSDLFRSLGLAPGWLRAPDDLRRLPLLTRPLLLKQRDRLVSTAPTPGRFVNFSSGSTGQRAEFVQDRRFIDFARALQFRGYGWCGGWQPGDRLALIWGSPVHQSFDGWRKRAARGLINRRNIDCYRLGRADLDTMLARLVAIQPTLISGYTTALSLLGRLAQRRNVRFDRLRGIQPTAEPVAHVQRQQLAEDFNVSVLSKYGSRETNMIAHDDPDGDGMLIQSENVFVEFLRPDGKACEIGEKGEVVVTTLTNNAMPLIRYRTGDIAAPQAIPDVSDRGLPRMSAVAGRMHDLLTSPDGGAVHPQLFSNIFMRFRAVDWFQVVQETPTDLKIRIVADGYWSSNQSDELQDEIRALTGQPFRTAVEVLPEMPFSKSGKQPLCVRLCDPPLSHD